ncbi:hypothetical protein [Pseudoalteromonas sp. M8]|uniref:hypothetical protein n=1 Tax=Pseudoalteromonas sp. M8 TaxID=2692624 RepID=UPI001BA85818|nr:hypothetical protein [Pseudoalteromonas sp. M8]QUI70537.1 hypothetical protein GSF13_12495 [Pseudoalteromonas sp. M8]
MSIKWIYALPVFIAILGGSISEIGLRLSTNFVPAAFSVPLAIIALLFLFFYQLLQKQKELAPSKTQSSYIMDAMLATIILFLFSAMCALSASFVTKLLLDLKWAVHVTCALSLTLIVVTFIASRKKGYGVYKCAALLFSVIAICAFAIVNTYVELSLLFHKVWLVVALLTLTFLLAVLFIEMSKNLPITHDRAKEFNSVQHLIIPLSDARDYKKHFLDNEKREKLLSKDKLNEVVDDLDSCNWAMPLSSISYHLDTLKSVTFFVSKVEGNKSKGSIDTVDILLNWLLDWTERCNKKVTFEVMGGSKFSDEYTKQFPYKPKLGLDFSSLSEIKQAIEDHVSELDKKSYYRTGDAVCIDVTGGTKATTLAAALATVNKPLFACYVNTNKKDEVFGYDLAIYQPAKLT